MLSTLVKVCLGLKLAAEVLLLAMKLVGEDVPEEAVRHFKGDK